MSTVERHRKRWNHEYTGAGKYCPPHCVEWQGGCRVPPEYCQDWRAWKNYADDLGELCENLSEEIERLKCCGNCGYCVDPDDDGVFWCEEDTYFAIRGDEPCKFTPSRWKEAER